MANEPRMVAQGEVTMYTATRAAAPTRFDFSGGPTDVEPFLSEGPGSVVNAALSLSATAEVTPDASSDAITLISEDLHTSETFSSVNDLELAIGGPLSLLKAIVAHQSPESGMTLRTSVGVPAGSGLGASAAVTVASIVALRTAFKMRMPLSSELVEMALAIENDLLGNINGGQDQFAAATGGWHHYIFEQGRRVQALELKPPTDFVSRLESGSMFCYSGQSHVSGSVISQVIDRFRDGDLKTRLALDALRSAAYEMADVVRAGDVEQFIEVLNRNHTAQQMLHPSIVGGNVERLVRLGLAAGAKAAKVAGAGGGGFVYFYVAPGQRSLLTETFRRAGYTTFPCSFSAAGPTVSLA